MYTTMVGSSNSIKILDLMCLNLDPPGGWKSDQKNSFFKVSANSEWINWWRFGWLIKPTWTIISTPQKASQAVNICGLPVISAQHWRIRAFGSCFSSCLWICVWIRVSLGRSFWRELQLVISGPPSPNGDIGVAHWARRLRQAYAIWWWHRGQKFHV